MALDTAEKRRSVSGVALVLPGVTPAAGQDSEWRLEAAWMYSGISVGVTVPTPSQEHTLTLRQSAAHARTVRASVTHAQTVRGSASHALEVR